MRTERKCRDVGRTLKLLKEVILDHWEHQLRKNLSEAFHADPIVLKDHFSEILDELILALDRNEIQEIYHARAHGFQRAILTNFTFQDVLQEFSILRMSIIDYLYPMGDIECSKFVHTFIDQAARDSISEFLRDVTIKKQFEKLPIEENQVSLN